MKRCLINTYNQGIYELPHELANDLTLTILRKQEVSENGLNFIK